MPTHINRQAMEEQCSYLNKKKDFKSMQLRNMKELSSMRPKLSSRIRKIILKNTLALLSIIIFRTSQDLFTIKGQETMSKLTATKRMQTTKMVLKGIKVANL